MKFVKGMITGMCISAGACMLYAEYTIGSKKMLKASKKMMKKIGIL